MEDSGDDSPSLVRCLIVQYAGNASHTIQGDYNFWFLPQAEDRLDVS
ncbi:MAG TPA: hypothetical protein VFV41_20135 [Streptosporangiaceae bacterium]|nr:hypothetical protein [Streptosporangiaceae bacterium]